MVCQRFKKVFATLSLLSGFMVGQKHTFAQNNNVEAWKKVQNSFKAKDWHSYFSLLSYLEQSSKDLSGADKCQLKELQILGLINICDKDAINEYRNQFTKLGCKVTDQNILSELFDGKLEPVFLDSKQNLKSSKSGLKEMYEKSRTWKIVNPEKGLENNLDQLRVSLPTGCRVGQSATLRFASEDLKQTSKVYEDLGRLGYLGSTYADEACDEYRGKTSESIILNLKRLSGYDESLVNVSIDYRVYIQKGDCLLADKSHANAFKEYNKAQAIAVSKAQSLFVEHRYNWVAVNQGSEHSKNRLHQLKELIQANTEKSALRTVLLSDLIDLSTQYEGGLIEVPSLIENQFHSDEDYKALNKIIQKSKIHARIKREFVNLIEKNEGTRLAFYKASLFSRKDSYGKTSFDPELACGSLEIINYKSFSKGQSDVEIWADSVACSNSVKKKKPAFALMSEIIKRDTNPEKFLVLAGKLHQFDPSDLELCNLAKDHRVSFLNGTLNYEIALSACFKHITKAQNEQFVKEILRTYQTEIEKSLVAEYQNTKKLHPYGVEVRKLVKSGEWVSGDILASSNKTLFESLYGSEVWASLSEINELKKYTDRSSNCKEENSVEKYVQCAQVVISDIVKSRNQFRKAAALIGLPDLVSKEIDFQNANYEVQQLVENELSSYQAKGMLNADELFYLKKQFSKVLSLGTVKKSGAKI